MLTRDIPGRTKAWYRFTETPGRTYGPRTVTWIVGAYGYRSTCEVAVDEAGAAAASWMPMDEVRMRVILPAATSTQLKRLQELGDPLLGDSLTRAEAKERIENLEALLPPTADEIEEARKAGVDLTGVRTRRDLSIAWEPIEAEEEERERVAALAPMRAALRKRGADVPENADEDELSEIEGAIESFESAIGDARDWDLPASRVPKPSRWTMAQFDVATKALEQFAVHAPCLTAEDVARFLGRDRNPKVAVMREALGALYDRFVADPTAWEQDPQVWFTAQVLQLEEEDKAARGKKATNGEPRAPALPQPRQVVAGRGERASRSPSLVESLWDAIRRLFSAS